MCQGSRVSLPPSFPKRMGVHNRRPSPPTGWVSVREQAMKRMHTGMLA